MLTIELRLKHQTLHRYGRNNISSINRIFNELIRSFVVTFHLFFRAHMYSARRELSRL